MNYVHLIKALFYDLLKKNKKSIKYYNKINSNNFYINYRLACNLYRDGKFKLAMPIFDKLISKGFDNKGCYYKAARIKEALGYKEEALNLMRLSMKHISIFGDLRQLDYYLKLGGFKYLRYSALIDSYSSLQFFRLANSKIKERRYHEALPALEILDTKWWYRNRCKELYKKINKAQKRELISIDAFLGKVEKHNYLSYFFAGKYSRLLEKLTNEKPCDPTEKILSILSNERIGNFDNAYNDLLNWDLKTSMALWTKIRLLFKLGKSLEAANEYEKNKQILNIIIKESKDLMNLDGLIRTNNLLSKTERIKLFSFILESIPFCKIQKLSNSQIFYLISNLGVVKNNYILYESFLGNTMSCNPYAIFKKISSDERYSDYLHIWVVNDNENIPPRYRGKKNIIYIRRDSVLYPLVLNISKYLINNVSFPVWFKPSKNQVYLNTWHGTPLKHLGIKNQWDKFTYQNVLQNLLNSDYIIHPNEYTEEVILRDYQILGLYKGTSRITGYPRIDLTLNTTNKEKEEIRNTLKVPEGKKILLYAPTWRDYEDLKTQIERTKKVLSILSTKDYFLIFKGHQFLEKSLRNENLPTVPSWLDTNELLSVVDSLVTDYSSIGIDFLVTKRPVYYLVDDFENYKQNRGTYINAEEFPGIVCKNIEELSHRLSSKVDYIVDVNSDKYIQKEDGNSTERVISLLFKKCISNNECSEKKNTILIYPGTLLNNGIFTACLNLVERLCDDYNVSLAISTKVLKDEQKQIMLSKFDSRVSIIPIDENLIIHPGLNKAFQFYKENNLNDPDLQNLIKQPYHFKFEAMFGRADLNAVINFEGYNIFFSNLFSSANENVKRIIFCHNSMLDEFSNKFAWLNKTFLTYVFYDNILSVGESTHIYNMKNLSNIFSVEPYKFDYVDNLINKENVISRSLLDDKKIDFIKEEGMYCYLTIGRMSSEKDQMKLIRAFEKVHKQKKNTKLIIIGSGYLMIYIVKLIQNLNLTDSVILLGDVENPYTILRKVDCFVLSSNYEGQPMVLLEALCLSKPIVSTRIIATEKMLDGSNAILSENSVDGLADAMLRQYDNPIPTIFDSNSYNEKSYNKLTLLMK